MNKKILRRIIILFLIIFLIILLLKSNLLNQKNNDEKILFLGDSLIARYDVDKYYKNYNIINSGVGGNQTTDILNDIENRVFKYNPDKIFILTGTNDIAFSGLDNESIKNNIEKLIDEIKTKLPDAKIYLQSIYPVNDNVNKEIVSIRTNDNIKKLNGKIKKICSKDKCTYINMYDKLTNKDGNLKRIYTTDGLHLRSVGYVRVTIELLKYINE